MKNVILMIILAVLKESHPLTPEILEYDKYMKDFEATGRQIKQEAKDKEVDGLIMKRESPHRADIEEEVSEDQETQSERRGDNEVEMKFKKMHPNWELAHRIPWREVENLTAEKLKDMCTQVLFDIYKSHATAASFPYTAAKDGKLDRRVLKKARVQLQSGLKIMPVIKCLYRTATFYLTKGDDKNVFRLERMGTGKPSTFYFHDGPHPIRYSET